MTFKKVMQRVTEKGSTNQEIFKAYSFKSLTKKGVIHINIFDELLTLTHKQFLKIYKILGE